MQHHAYNRLGSSGGGGGITPSPPASPRRSPRLGRRSGKDGPGGGWGRRFPPGPGTLVQRWALAAMAMLLRRQAIFLFAPLIYVAGMLFYMGTISLDSMPAIISRPPTGSVYRSLQLYNRLQPDMDADNSTDGILYWCLM